MIPPQQVAGRGSMASSEVAPDETTDFIERVEETDTALEETTDAADDTEIGGAVDPASRRVFFIGIAGPSCGGKSTLARQLVAALNSPLNPVPLDGYFLPSQMPRHPEFGKNWELPEGVDFKRLLQDLHLIESVMSSTEAVPERLVITADRGPADIVRSGMGNSRLAPGAPIVVVVEGFLLFYQEDISQMFDCSLWVQADCLTCSSRRHRRDAPGVPFEKFDRWYSGLVWSHFEMFQAQQLNNADGALRLDATKPPEVILEEAAAYCNARLSLS